MKKVLSLILALMVVASSAIFTVSAADVSSTYLDSETFFYSFENESDLTHSGMRLDEQGTDNFQDPDIKNYTTPGAGGSNGAVGIHVETAVNNGNTSNGVTGFVMYPGKEYELSFKIKLFSTENLKKAPQMGVFFMTNNAEMFTDEACTQSEGRFSNRYQYTTHDLGTVIPVNNGVVSDGWHTYTTKVSIGTKFSSGYVPADQPVPVFLFLRIGGVHALTDASIYTDEFLASCGTHMSGTTERKSLWFEYAIDDIGFCPVSYEEEVVEEDPALWRVNFEKNDWQTSEVLPGFMSSTAIVSDVPAEIADTSKGALEATYAPHTGNNGYMEFNIYTTNEDKKLQFNRAYLITYWLKGSPAMAEYYADKGKGDPGLPNPANGTSVTTQLIPERGKVDRLERTWPKWQGYSMSYPLTETWTKHSAIWYEEIPEALGVNEEAANVLSFHLRIAAVPCVKDATTWSWTSSKGNTYKASDFKMYLDEFSIMPLDLAYNGDFARDGSDTEHSTVGYNGAAGKVVQGYNVDAVSATAFKNGTITEDASFAAATGIQNENVLKVTTEDGAPAQNIRIEKGRDYRIGFWAKADDAASVGKQINTVLDRDIIGEIRDNQVTTVKETKSNTDVTINTEEYDGYGALTGVTGSIPKYLYSGTLENKWHNPTVLSLNGPTETLVYDDFYDRAFSKNTQAGKEPTAWVYQYYNGSEWVNTNTANSYSTTNVLSDEWTYYEMDYRWDYVGKHYRIPSLVIDADANYSLANIKVEDVTDVIANPAEFTATNIQVVSETGSDILYTGDKFTVTWDFESTNGVATQEANGGSLVKVYQVNGSEKALIGTAKADAAGRATLTATANLFGKDLAVEVVPLDVNGDYGISASVDTEIKVALAVDTSFKLAAGETSVDFSATIKSDEITGNATAYVAAYDSNNQLVSVKPTVIAYQDGDNTVSGNVPFADAAVTLKLFLWDSETFAPMIKEKTIEMKAVVSDPFAGDDTINVVYLGDSLYAGAGSSNTNERWVNQVGAWYEETYAKDGVTVNNFYKGAGGTTTEYSVARLYRDVIANDPDVVYISHTCNDGNRDTRRNMEIMVRTLMELENPPYIIFTRSTNRGLSESNGYGNQVAEHYGLPLIDDREAYVRALAENGNAMADYFIADGVHPNDLGYDVITGEIIARMETGRYWYRPTEPSAKLLENSGNITSMTSFSSQDARVTASGFTAVSASKAGMKSTAVGDTLSFSFTGNVLAFEYGLNEAASKIEIWVDNELKMTCDPYYNGQTGNMLVGKEGSLLLDLENGTHNVVMKTVTGQAASATPQTVVYDIFTGTWEK